LETWGDQFYPNHYSPGDQFTVDTDHLVWVSSPPELKAWAKSQGVSRENLDLRIKQYLGMPPDASKTLFVEFWADPADLFRPCPDPEISDREAEIDFPSNPYFSIQTEYRDWFNLLRATYYTGPSAHPWTRLGYTYDWGIQTGHVGISEFVIRASARPTINAMVNTAEYLGYVPPLLAGGDYDGDGTSEAAVFRSGSGEWIVRNLTRVYFGSSGDTPVSGDYSGDETTEIAVFRPAAGLWLVRGSTQFAFGAYSDIAVPADYAGDGRADPAVFSPLNGEWEVRGITRMIFGSWCDRPLPGDYDGNGTAEAALFRSSDGRWTARGTTKFYFGSSADFPVPADYDGDGGLEAGIFRPASGLWAVRGITRTYFGGSYDQSVPADFDGDGRDDPAVFRDGSGEWAVPGVTRFYFGYGGDTPAVR
ncbi:MAG: hypothetical protein NTV79_06105, partial [Candidatus Aureabacteria bacterium]|nr:hypothetical protein [Candidatus Auribacterota bacterium]